MNVKKPMKMGNSPSVPFPKVTYTLVITIPQTELIQQTSVVVIAGEKQEAEIYVVTKQYRLEGVEVYRQTPA